MHGLTLSAFITALVPLGCYSPSPNTFSSETLPLVLADSVMLPREYLGGDIVSLRWLGDSTYVFADYITRSLETFHLADTSVYQIGGHGEGPGEYRLPAYVRLGNEGEIVFSDISNPRIKFILPDGSQTGVLTHSHGGGRKFDLLEDVVYIQSNELYLLSAYNRSGQKLVELFPIDKSYEPFIQRLNGGGVTVIGQSVYAMNSLEPHIYVYNARTRQQIILKPDEWKKYGANFDRNRVEQLSLSNWGEESEDFAFFMDIDKLIFEQSSALVIFLRYRSRFLLNIISLDGKVLYGSEIEGLWFVGSQQDLLFFVVTNEDIDKSTLLVYRMIDPNMS